MVGIRGLSVRLMNTDGKHIKEYETRLHDDRTVSCYVTSEAGQPFSIEVDNCVNSLRFTDSDFISFRILVDGVHVDSQVCRWQTTEVIAGIPSEAGTASGEQKRFVFANIRSSSKRDMFRQDWRSWERFGLVEIQAYRVQRLGVHDKVNDCPAMGDVLNHAKYVHEKSTFAEWHHTRAGSAIPQPQSRCQISYIDRKDHPFAVLRVFYRPKELLETRSMIPHPVTTYRYNATSGIIAKISSEGAVQDRFFLDTRRAHSPEVKQELNEIPVAHRTTL